MGGIINSVVIVGAGLFGVVVIYSVWRNYRLAKAEKELREEIKTLPIDFSSSGNAIFGPSGVWVLEIKNLSEALAKASIIKARIKEKINTEVAVQPVLVLDNSKAETKFSFFKVEGVYVIQRKWLNKLIREFPVENLDGIAIEKIKSSLS
jgi:myo-inositol-1-phosphate synthase